jgi:hypothetical protein
MKAYLLRGIPEAVYEAIRDLGKEKGVSIREIIMRAIEAFLRGKKNENANQRNGKAKEIRSATKPGAGNRFDQGREVRSQAG